MNEPKPVVGGAPLEAAVRQRLFYVEGSARVRRWHTEPVLHQQTVGEHTYSVLFLVLLLTDWEASKELLVAALMHDTAERKFGDVPSPTKRRLNIKSVFDSMEDEHMEAMGLRIPTLGVDDLLTLKMADSLEGGMFCAFELRRGNRDIRDGFRNYLNYIAALDPTGLARDLYNQLYKEYIDVFGQ